MPNLPSCFDRADGVTTIPGSASPWGTPTPSGALITRGSAGTSIRTEEFPDSPEIERAEQATITHRFKLSWANGLTAIATTGRGKVEVDSAGNVTRVLSAKLQHGRGETAEFTKVSESVSFDTPIDEFAVTPFELGINILKHPRYFYSLDPTSSDSTNTVTVNDITVSLSKIKQTIIRAVQTYIDSPVYPSVDNINGLFQNNIGIQMNSSTVQVAYPNSSFNSDPKVAPEVAPVEWNGKTADKPSANCRYFLVPVSTSTPAIQLALAAAREIISKVWRQEDTPYVVGYKIHWVRYFFRPPQMNPGGYLESPLTANPSLPDYFGSPSGDYAIDTIFDDIAINNPQCYADPNTGRAVFSCLRMADECEYQRTWFKQTMTWMCVPVGHWDVDLYMPMMPRPNLNTYTSPAPYGYRPFSAT